MAAESSDRWRNQFFFFLWTILSLDDPQKFSYWSDVAFYTCNYDVITKAPLTSSKITLIPHEEYLPCAKFKIFPWCGFRDRCPNYFPVFQTWLPHHVTYDVTIMIKTFYMCSRTYVENFVSIRQAVVEKNTKVLCGQTNKQTDKRTEMQKPLLQRG